MQYFFFLKRKFCITQPPCESGSKYLLLLWVIWGGEWALEWAEQLCWLCCCFRCLHNLPWAIEIYRGYLWQCRNTSHFIHRFPKAQSIQSSDFLWMVFLKIGESFQWIFWYFLWSGSDSKTLEFRAARSSSKLRTPGAPIVELPGAMDSGLDCALSTSTVSDCVSLSGANQEQYFSMARLPFFLLCCQLRIQNDSFESQCTAPWSILIHLDPSWSILIHLDPSWSILIHLDPYWVIPVLQQVDRLRVSALWQIELT